MASHIPSVEQVMALPALIEGTVTPEFIDVNGHMNIRHYMDYGAEGADRICREIGIDDAYRDERRMGVFTVEHHLRYLSELRQGDKFSVHTRVLDRSDKAIHLLSMLLDRTRDQLSNTLEIVLLHVRMDSRRPEAMPVDVAAGWDRYIAQSTALDWEPPVCGAMGVKR